MQNSKKSHFIDEIIDRPIVTRALSGLGYLIIISLGIVSILDIKANLHFDALITTLAILPIIIALFFLKKNYTETAGMTIAGAMIIMITILATFGQGIYDIGTMAYPAILIIVSLILKRETVAYLTMLIIICDGWLVFGAIANIYYPTYPQNTYVRQFFITSLILIVTMSAVFILANIIRNSLASAQKELQERKRVEDALREAETMYRALVEQTSVVTYRDLPDLDASFAYISPQVKDLIGFTQQEWNSDSLFWKKLIHPDDLPRVLNEIKNYIETKAKTVSEYRLRHKDGHWVWVRDEAIVICDDNGTPLYVHGVYIDITEKKAAELAVKQREAILGAAAKTAQLLLKTADWHSQIDVILQSLGQAANASHVYLFDNHQGSEGQVLYSQRYEWAAPDMETSLQRSTLQDNPLFPVTLGKEEWHERLSSGTFFYGNEKQYPDFWSLGLKETGVKALLEVPIFVHGKWWGFIGFDDHVNELPWSQIEIDVLVATAGNIAAAIERQITDTSLRKSEEKFQLAFHHTYTAMAINRSKDHTLIDVNNAFCKVTGYSKEDAIGKRAGRDLHIWKNPSDRDTIMDQLYAKGYVDEYEAEFRRKNGDIGTALLSAVNINIAGEACQLFSFYDISRINFLMKELGAKNDELQSFTYTVSHDLRAPLVTMSGFLGYLEQDAKNGNTEKVLHDTNRIKEAVRRMEHLLSELLELSRIGRIMNPPEDIRFGDIVQDALQAVEGRLHQKQIEVKIDTNFPIVRGDRVRLTEVVQNLVDNAAKFTGTQEKPQIEIGSYQQNGKTIFFVRDNGIGIEPEFREKVFGLFSKLDAQSEGTGIGLALVKRIVEVHGGNIWVESDGSGKGSTFCFTLANHINEGTS